MNPRTAKILFGTLLLLLGLAALRDLARLGAAAPWRAMDDFPDFYCAGAALDAGASPYTYEPLHACEHQVNAGAGFRARVFAANPSLTVPAPQPAYDFLPFMALARLPFAAGRTLDAIAIVAAVALCIAALAALGVPAALAVAALLLSTGYAELNTGQIVPFALLAVVLCGLALARHRDAWAGVAAALAAIEPSVGLPVVAATAAFVPRARIGLASTLAIMVLTSFFLLGARGLTGYVTAVLPAHAVSELHFPFQYSLTYVASYAGFSPAAARAAGILSYLIMLGIGLWLAPRATRTTSRPELVVFVPAMCAVIAGPFLHQEELCFALPALLVLSVATRGPARTIVAAALCALAVPWILVWGTKQLFLASLFVCAVILAVLRIERWAAVAIFCATGIALYAFELHPPQLPAPAAMNRQHAPGEFAELAWAEYTAARASSDPLWIVIKFPAWSALLAALGVTAITARRAPD